MIFLFNLYRFEVISQEKIVYSRSNPLWMYRHTRHISTYHSKNIFLLPNS